ncbi:hypothetical protein ABZV80_43210 [Streptomyces sp. NPDC005132]
MAEVRLTAPCERDCGAHGSEPYPSTADAERYARAFDHEDAEDLG